MTRLRAILALALAAAPLTLAACGHPPPSIVVRAQPGDRAGGLTATGSATIGVSPDCADLTLTITREATDARAAIAQVRDRQAALVATLARLGLPSADVTLAHLGVDPVYDYVDGKSVLRGYQASTVITATTRQFDQIAPLMEAAADAGATAQSSRPSNASPTRPGWASARPSPRRISWAPPSTRAMPSPLSGAGRPCAGCCSPRRQRSTPRRARSSTPRSSSASPPSTTLESPSA